MYGPALVVGVLVALVGWPSLELMPGQSIDPSWSAGLHMSLHTDLVWGRDLIFTYGPLGFLKRVGYWYDDTGALSVLYFFVTRVAFGAAVWALGRATFGRVGAALVAVVVTPIVPDPMPPLVLGWGLWLLARDRGDRATIVFAATAGVVGGLELLGKMNIGLLVFALAAITVLFAPRRSLRLATVFALATLGGILLGWLATGQPILALNDYFINALDVMSGYSMAMHETTEFLTWHYTAAAVIFALGAYGLFSASELWPSRSRAGAMLLLLVTAFLGFKSAFVREDVMHAPEYFGLMAGAFAVIPWKPGRWDFALASLAAVLIVVMSINGYRLDPLWRPVDRLADAGDDLSTLFDGDERERLRREGIEGVTGAWRLDPKSRALLEGHTLHVEPFETSIVWAYDLPWKPLPVFHSYQAYTDKLDEINARTLRGGGAPSRVMLTIQPASDSRIPGWETPAAMQALLCHYLPLHQAPQWLIVGRAENRCGHERYISSAEAEWGEPVSVPPKRDDALVIAKIRGTGPGLAERVRAMLYKGDERWARIDGGDRHRLIPSFAENGVLLNAPDGVDYPPPYTRSQNVHTLSVDREGDPDGTVRFDFYAIPITR